MGKINLKRVYHIGIPVNDLERAERFYVDVLGMKVHGPMAMKADGKRNYRVSDDNKPWQDELGYWPETLRLCCSDDNVEVVLVKRPKPIERDWKRIASITRRFRRLERILICFWRRRRIGE